MAHPHVKNLEMQTPSTGPDLSWILPVVLGGVGMVCCGILGMCLFELGLVQIMESVCYFPRLCTLL